MELLPDSDPLDLFAMKTGALFAAALLAGDREAPMSDRVSAIRDAVRQFEAGQPPFDDLTLLLACWYGQPPSEH